MSSAAAVKRIAQLTIDSQRQPRLPDSHLVRVLNSLMTDLSLLVARVEEKMDLIETILITQDNEEKQHAGDARSSRSRVEPFDD